MLAAVCRACVVSDGSAAMLWTVEGGVYAVCELKGAASPKLSSSVCVLHRSTVRVAACRKGQRNGRDRVVAADE